MPEEKKTGECEGCGNDPRQLVRIESGQWLCRTCLRNLRPPRPKHLASWKEINQMRQAGFDVGAELTKDRLRTLKSIIRARKMGIRLRDGATDAEVEAALLKASPRQPTSFYSKVRGVSRRNPDGSDRQTIASKCRRGEKLILVREPDNPRDRNAVKVMRRGGFLSGEQQLGYLSAEVAEEIAPLLDRGERVEAEVTEVTGGGGGWFSERKHFGVNIRIRR